MESSGLASAAGKKRRGEKAHKKCDDCRRKKIKVSDQLFEGTRPDVFPSIVPSCRARLVCSREVQLV
jgi:hypothetical protein